MHALTIARRSCAVDWQFLFKTEEAAEKAYAAATNQVGVPMIASASIEIKDDFGQRCRVNPSDITGVLLENQEESKLAHVENALHQARTRNTIMQRANSDPALKFAMGNGGSPAMLSPMGGGRM